MTRALPALRYDKMSVKNLNACREVRLQLLKAAADLRRDADYRYAKLEGELQEIGRALARKGAL